MESIDWDDLRIGYNRVYNKKYKTVKEFLKETYEDNNRNISKLARLLGVSHGVLSVILDKLSIRKRLKLTNKKLKFKNISPEKMKMMTKREISIECDNMGEKYLGLLLKQYNRKYLRVQNGGIYHARMLRESISNS